MDALRSLSARWRDDAVTLRRYGDTRGADVCERMAGELEEAIAAADREELSLAEAARESGYSTRRLRELTAAGQLVNVGRKGAPRYRRADLPKKAAGSERSGYDPASDARDLVARMQRRVS